MGLFPERRLTMLSCLPSVGARRPRRSPASGGPPPLRAAVIYRYLLETSVARVERQREVLLSRVAPRIPGFQPPVVTRRARGRITGAAVIKGGDVAIYVRAGVHLVPLEDRPLAAADDILSPRRKTALSPTEACGVRILGARPLDIWCLYRPPIRKSAADQREDNFDPDRLPSDDATIIVGDFNAHHPLWDSACDTVDATGERVADWLDRAGWTALNSGQPTLLDRQTAPDVAACSTELARRTTWALTESLGSDHLPMVMKIRNGCSATPRMRKPRWAFKKADWASWAAECEAALAEAPPPRATAQELCALFTAVLQKASSRSIPRGSRADSKPWASDPQLEETVADRRAAQASIDPTDPSTIERWREARRRAAEVDSRVSRERFRDGLHRTQPTQQPRQGDTDAEEVGMRGRRRPSGRPGDATRRTPPRQGQGEG